MDFPCFLLQGKSQATMWKRVKIKWKWKRNENFFSFTLLFVFRSMFVLSSISILIFLGSQQEWIEIKEVDFLLPDNQPKTENNATSTERANRQYQSFPRPPQCTKAELMKVRHQLPPELCVRTHVHRGEFLQLCSITSATKCPKATWLDDHYLDLQKKRINPPPPFLGISVGCNKGFDAINTLRMGTYDDTINKKDWKEAMIHDGSDLFESVCNQDSPLDVFEVLQHYQKNPNKSNNTGPNRPVYPHGEMHCIEPMPQTFLKLNHSAEILGYKHKGLMITNAAVSKKSGKMLFPTAGLQGGVENKGLDSCRGGGPEIKINKMCEYVKVYSLSDFVNEKVKANNDNPINILSIDVEGFDGDVLIGATEFVLQRVEYLEFEYNWMGSWKNQHLYDIVNMLDVIGGFTCYWAGVDRLWRLTDCWMAYYDVKTWSNVACVNRHLVPTLASRMENIFQRTLNDTKQWITDKSQWAARMGVIKAQFSNHFLMSTKEEDLRSKYAHG